MKLEYHTRVLKESSDFVLLYRYYILYILHLFFLQKHLFSREGLHPCGIRGRIVICVSRFVVDIKSQFLARWVSRLSKLTVSVM